MWPATLTQQHSEFLQFWKKLEALAKQQQLQRTSNASINKKTHVDIISIIADQQALASFQRKQRWRRSFSFNWWKSSVGSCNR
jgi:hypothetical protein